MMTELQKTMAFVVTGVVLAGGAAVTSLAGRTGTPTDFNDQGQKFFPAFMNPLICTALEVVDYDATTETPLPFKVMKQEGKWVIPSHYNYPADGKDRLSKTASGVIDLRKDTIRSDSAEDHPGMGVVDPLDAKTTYTIGRGKRVTLRDGQNNVLADLIIGKEVTGHPSQRYVRIPGKNRTYGVNVNVDLSTRFADWIETNLLKLEPTHARKVVFDGTKVDIANKRIVPGEVLTINRADSAAPWLLDGLPPDDELDPDKLSALTRELGDLKISGVRPKPQGLTRSLMSSEEKGVNLSDAALISLQQRGFYLVRDGRLLSDQGEVRVATDEGVVYTLRFGGATFSADEEPEGGPDAAKKTDAGKKTKDKSTTESRYLFVTAQFEPAMIPETKEPENLGPLKIPSNVFVREANDPTLLAEQKAEQEKLEKQKKEREGKIEDGKKRTKEVTDRFAAWYYVVPSEAFRSITLNRSTLVRKKGAGKPATPSGFPNLPGGGAQFPSLPPGFDGSPPPQN
jgi:hypothetical protein